MAGTDGGARTFGCAATSMATASPTDADLALACSAVVAREGLRRGLDRVRVGASSARGSKAWPSLTVQAVRAGRWQARRVRATTEHGQETALLPVSVLVPSRSAGRQPTACVLVAGVSGRASAPQRRRVDEAKSRVSGEVADAEA